ncbi:hypothetical protein [Paenibacillus sp. tmac-D7]|uniref:hypothetical protein n=1 Tax=Paenibacillus sp. tmac-D7 TaxID=2591462 RepID=UPI00114305B5|nr:hypothetical protein [Paenibacillus sp. tmac-D7]
MKVDLLQLAFKFIQDEIDEITYISRHDRDWYEVKELAATDPLTFGILLRKLSLPYRRKALRQAFDWKDAELRRFLIGEFSKSASTISDLFNIEKIAKNSGEKLYGRFSIVHRVPYMWVSLNGDLLDRWDSIAFRFSATVISKMKDVAPLLELSKKQKVDVEGFLIRSNLQEDLCLRLETRADAIVVDFYHSDTVGLDQLMNVLKSTSFTWSGFITQSVIPGYRYWTFIGAEDDLAIARIMETEFKYIQNTMRLC